MTEQKCMCDFHMRTRRILHWFIGCRDKQDPLDNGQTTRTYCLCGQWFTLTSKGWIKS